jgi:large subunit ribosomal protein L6
MSRIGKLPIKIPSNVDVICNGLDVTVKGKFGTLQNQVPNVLGLEKTDGTLVVSLKNKTRTGSALHGLYRTLINNMVIGVSEQFQLKLNLNGVGYRASVQGKSLVLGLSFFLIVLLRAECERVKRTQIIIEIIVMRFFLIIIIFQLLN